MGRGDRVHDVVDASVIQTMVEKFLCSDVFLNKFVSIVAEKLDRAISDRLKKLDDKVNSLQNELEIANNRITELEQQSKLKQLRIYGLKTSDNSSEDSKTVVNLINNKMGQILSNNDVVHVMRGKRLKNGSIPLVVRFSSVEIRNEVYRHKSNLKGTKIVIKEELAPNRHKLYLAACRAYGISNVWTSYGQIWAKSADGVRKVHDVKSLPVNSASAASVFNTPQ